MRPKIGKNLNMYTYYVAYSVAAGVGKSKDKSVVITLPYYVGSYTMVKQLYDEIQKDEDGEIFIYGFTLIKPMLGLN